MFMGRYGSTVRAGIPRCGRKASNQSVVSGIQYFHSQTDPLSADPLERRGARRTPVGDGPKHPVMQLAPWSGDGARHWKPRGVLGRPRLQRDETWRIAMAD